MANQPRLPATACRAQQLQYQHAVGTTNAKETTEEGGRAAYPCPQHVVPCRRGVAIGVKALLCTETRRIPERCPAMPCLPAPSARHVYGGPHTTCTAQQRPTHTAHPVQRRQLPEWRTQLGPVAPSAGPAFAASSRLHSCCSVHSPTWEPSPSSQLLSASTTSSAVLRELAGFWPVTRLPSRTAWGAHFSLLLSYCPPSSFSLASSM